MQNQEEIELREEKFKKLEILLANTRSDWSKRLKDLTKNLRLITTLVETNALISSYRAMLVENTADLSIKIRKFKSSFNINYKQLYHKYLNHDYKLLDKRIDIMIHADLSYKLNQIGLLEAQKNFYIDQVKGLDQMAWAVKNRISIESLL